MPKPYYESEEGTIYQGDCLHILRELPPESVHTIVTSPPYWGLRDYGVDGQFGLEPTPEEYVGKSVEIFRECRRVLRDDGTLWLNLGDSYAAGGLGQGSGKQKTNHGSCNGSHIEKARVAPDGLKPKDLVGIPWRVAFALQADGWYLRQDIIWHKPNPMPESVNDRCTKAHEYIFLLSKSARYFYDQDPIRNPHKEASLSRWAAGGEDTDNTKYSKSKRETGVGNLRNGSNPLNTKGANRRSVWTIPTKPFSAAHFATFPPKLIEPCIMAGCPKGGVVLDPFFGAGTTGITAYKLGRKFIGIELNEKYLSEIAVPRVVGETRQLKLFPN